MDPAALIALIAQVRHGPQLHGGVIPVVLVAIVLVGGLAYVLHRRGKGSDRKPGSGRDPGSDRGPEA